MPEENENKKDVLEEYLEAKRKDKILFRYVIVLVICIVFSVFARLANAGWLLFFIMVYGPVHAIVFLISNMFLTKTFEYNKSYKILFYVSCITFVLPYLLYPDFGDIGGPYAVFNSVHDAQTIDVLSHIAKISLGINIVTIIAGFVFQADIKQKNKEEQLRKMLEKS